MPLCPHFVTVSVYLGINIFFTVCCFTDLNDAAPHEESTKSMEGTQNGSGAG
jgi:hypothetical protein